MATTVISAAKTVLLAVHLAAKGDVAGLAYLVTTEHGRRVLHTELLLRVLLSYLPETLKSAEYVPLLQAVAQSSASSPTAENHDRVEFDAPAIEELSEEQAIKKVRKLRLLQLSTWPEAPAELALQNPEDGAGDEDDEEDEDIKNRRLLALFLVRRAYRVDEEAGLLTEIPELFAPFLDHAPYLRTWLISVLLPLLRRNYEYYPDNPLPQTLAAFEQLPDRAAVTLLLSRTGVVDDAAQEGENDFPNVGRDLRGLIAPWLYKDARWTSRTRGRSSVAAPTTERDSNAPVTAESPADPRGLLCPGWEQMLEWLTAQATKSWRVAVGAIDQWDGPGDADLGDLDGVAWLKDEEQEYLEHRFARAALSCAYLVPEASVDALAGAYGIVAKVMSLLDLDPPPPLQTAASLLPPMLVVYIDDLGEHSILSPQNATHLRSDLLEEANPLTRPSAAASQLVHAASLSAFILTRAGHPCTVKRAAELCLLQNEREQKAEASKLIHTISNHGPKTDDKYWIRARNEILWLRDWGAEEEADPWSDAPSPPSPRGCRGIFGQVKKEFLQVEILKGLLNNTRYHLACSLYEESSESPLPKKVLQDTIFATALNAYDNASNPNRTRGGLKKCADIIYAFPKTVEKSLAATQRVEALLKATHALSEYRLVLKQGEPFTPVVLRVHPDPVSIVAKVLEQNPKSYTNIQTLIDLGANMVEAGLVGSDGLGLGQQRYHQSHEKRQHSVLAHLTPEQEAQQRIVAERRVTAMCIDAALTEDDFETAYSYVVNRLSATTAFSKVIVDDDWSWKAALQAGKYRRTPRTVRPTHLGTSTANPEIRHLEQRIECLSTALRIAPPPTLQEILNAFRRCEEELDVAVRAEAEAESAWDDAGDKVLQDMPGGFGGGKQAQQELLQQQRQRQQQASSFSPAARHQTEEAPLSLFDLSRATARAAQRNFTALSSLQRSSAASSGPGSADMARTSTDSSAHSRGGSAGTSSPDPGQQPGEPRVRKRDQLRDAAMGSLVSGVGWLVGAQPIDRHQDGGKD